MFFLSDLQKIFIRKFKVSSASEEDDEEEHDDGYVYYRWRIQLKFINAQGATLQSEPFVEKVTFELHPDFDTPRRVFKKPPYLVKEVGWGGFEIPITIHFARGSPIEKFETTFLLNLPADKKPQTFEMKFINPNPEFLILLNQNHTPPGSNTSGTTSSKTISKSPALLVARNRSKSMPTTNNSSLPRPVNAHPSITNNYDQGDEDADGVIDSDAEEEDLRSTQTEVFDVGGGVGVSISRLVEQMERARGEKALRLAQKLDELIEDIPSETRSVLIRSDVLTLNLHLLDKKDFNHLWKIASS